MVVRFLTFAGIIAVAFAQCPYAYTALNGGTVCQQSTYCNAVGGSGYQCMNGQCCRINGLCNVDEISVGYDCLRVSSEGGQCVNTSQCQPNGSLQCLNGYCRRPNNDQGVKCSNPSQQIERENGALKNCLRSACSYGYICEYSLLANQYICCGSGSTGGYGKIQYYPGTNMPLKCYGSSDCAFLDTPNCVLSQRYGHNVCCSTFRC